MKLRLVIFFVFIFFCTLLTQEAHAGQGFKELVRALQSKKITQLELKEVETKYAGQNIEGRAYIINIGEDVSGTKVVTMCTEKETDHPQAVTVIVYLRKGFDGILWRFKPGDFRYCFGPFKEIRMRSIVIEGGFVK